MGQNMDNGFSGLRVMGNEKAGPLPSNRARLKDSIYAA